MASGNDVEAAIRRLSEVSVKVRGKKATPEKVKMPEANRKAIISYHRSLCDDGG